MLSVIIPTKDRGRIFEESLRSVIEAIHGLDAEVIVVNDSKTTQVIIPPSYRQVSVVNNPKSGVASARNLGASRAKGDLIIFMDDDFNINKECIRKTIQLVNEDPHKIHLFNWSYPPSLYLKLRQSQFGRYLVRFGFDSVQGWLGEEWNKENDIFELKHGASYFLPIMKKKFEEIGGYDEKFPHAGAEDYDFIQRAKKKGIRFFLNKTCLLYHNESDRVELIAWLERKKRNGQTMKVASNLGYNELAISYSANKKVFWDSVMLVKPLFFLLLKSIPNKRWFDALYFKIVNILLGLSLYEGYYESK